MKKEATKNSKIPKKSCYQNHCKGGIIYNIKTNIASPKIYSPSVQNMNCYAKCMIMCEFYGIPVLGATCACREWSYKGVWTLTIFNAAGMWVLRSSTIEKRSGATKYLQ